MLQQQGETGKRVTSGLGASGGCWRGVTGEREAFFEGGKKQTEASISGAVQGVR